MNQVRPGGRTGGAILPDVVIDVRQVAFRADPADCNSRFFDVGSPRLNRELAPGLGFRVGAVALQQDATVSGRSAVGVNLEFVKRVAVLAGNDCGAGGVVDND